MESIPSRRVSISVDPEPEVVAGGPAEVLFVSDDQNLCAVVMRALENDDYRLHTVSHSGHALLTGMKVRIDVLVAELCMPDLSVPALAGRLRRQHPDLRAIFLANPGTPEGVENVLVRPFTRDDLASRIEAAVAALRV
jgi:DNA-binding NtrC family response regulator